MKEISSPAIFIPVYRQDEMCINYYITPKLQTSL